MKHNEHDQERSQYNQLISQKETQIRELGDDKRKIEETIHRLEEDLQRGFHALRMLDDECAANGYPKNLRLQQENDEQHGMFRRQLEESNEEISAVYRNETKKMEQEREELYTKRGEVPWD